MLEAISRYQSKIFHRNPVSAILEAGFLAAISSYQSKIFHRNLVSAWISATIEEEYADSSGGLVMPLERRMSRDIFAPGEIVQLKQMCLTPGKVFTPGKYIVGELPDTAFEMGLVEAIPPVKGKNAQIKDTDASETQS